MTADPNMSILVVDDYNTMVRIIRKLLKQIGYENVDEASNGEEALQKYRELGGGISLLILDVIMPKKSGREVLEEARLISPDVKAVFTSGYPADLVRKEGFLEKGLHFLSKPSSPNELLRKVREVLDQ